MEFEVVTIGGDVCVRDTGGMFKPLALPTRNLAEDIAKIAKRVSNADGTPMFKADHVPDDGHFVLDEAEVFSPGETHDNFISEQTAERIAAWLNELHAYAKAKRREDARVRERSVSEATIADPVKTFSITIHGMVAASAADALARCEAAGVDGSQVTIQETTG